MSFHPPHPDSLSDLRRLRDEVSRRGDDGLAMMLAGVELFAVLGREFELLEYMQKFAHDAEEMVQNTPTAAELRKLYERQDEPGSSNS